MKNIIKYTGVAILAISLLGCEDFGDLNENPNATTTAISSNLLTNALLSVGGTITATQGQHYVQYLANSQYTSADNYQTINFDYNGWYAGPLADLERIIDLNTDEDTKLLASASGSNANQIAIARIMQSYYFMHITDRWGAIPYSESLRADEEMLNPAFDTQEAVYNGLFTTLKSAQDMIDISGAVDGDILFGGDMAMWKKFANTMRMIAALRLSNVNASKGKTEFNAAISDGVIATDNSENVIYATLADANFQSPWYARFLTRRDYCVSNTLVDYMQSATNGGTMDVAMDPRLPVFADTTENSGGYVGMTYGISEARAGAISNSDVSFLGAAMREQDSEVVIYSAAQVLFSMAEAAQLGWTSGDVEQLYEDAIQASLEQYGVGGDFATYITNTEVAFDPARALEQIGTQKWVTLFLNGYESWAEWRRTGYPSLTPAEDALNEGAQIPVRQAYPTTERDLNETNYNAIVAIQGADKLSTKVWWDK